MISFRRIKIVSEILFQNGIAFALFSVGNSKKSKEHKVNCFFLGGTANGDRLSREGMVSFAIPDLGVLFKTRHFGSSFECEYVSLLALLAFIEKNLKIFSQQKIRIYTENPLIVHQINKRASCSQDLEPHRDRALNYKERFCYSISWILSHENRAREVFFDRPVSHENPDLGLGCFANSAAEKSGIGKVDFHR